MGLWMDGWVDKCMYVCMMDEWVDGYGSMDGWIDG